MIFINLAFIINSYLLYFYDFRTLMKIIHNNIFFYWNELGQYIQELHSKNHLQKI
jgi:hypothetical protein